MHDLNASWHRFLIDFGRFWVPRRASKSTQNRYKIDLGRQWRPQGRPRPTQDPPKTLPSQGRKSTPNRPKIGPKSTQHRPNIDPTFTQNFHAEANNHNRPRMQAYKDTSVQGQSDIRGFRPTCYTGPPNFRTRVEEGAGGSGRSP